MSFAQSSLGSKPDVRGPTVFDEIVVTANNLSPLANTDAATKAYTDEIVNIPDNSIDTADIADLAVTSAKIATGGVTTAKIGNFNVTTSKIASKAVTSANIFDNNVVTAVIANGAVETTNIADLAVTTDVLSNFGILSSDFGAGAVTNSKLATNAVTSAKLATNAVDTTALPDGVVGTTNLADLAVTSAKIANGAVTTAKIPSGVVLTSPTLETPTFQSQLVFDQAIGLSRFEVVQGGTTDNIEIKTTNTSGSSEIGIFINNTPSSGPTPTENALGIRENTFSSSEEILRFPARDKQSCMEIIIPSATSKNFIRSFRNATGDTFRVDIFGAVANLTGTYGTISDRRLKINAIPAKSQWDDFKAIEFVNFNLKKEVLSDSNDVEEKVGDIEEGLRFKQLGVIAQQLERAGLGGLVYEENGIKKVKMSILMLKGVGALQEAMSRIEALETKLIN